MSSLRSKNIVIVDISSFNWNKEEIVKLLGVEDTKKLYSNEEK